MAIWLPNKAKPHEKNRRHRNERTQQRFCRICGKPITYGAICPNCRGDHRQKERNMDK